MEFHAGRLFAAPGIDYPWGIINGVQNYWGETLTPFVLILVTLAAARIVHFITLDRVPFGAIREWLKDRAYDQDTKVVPQQPWNWLAALVVCAWCVGVYVVLPFAILAVVFLPVLWISWLSLPFAMMMGASFLGGWVHYHGGDDDNE